MAIDLDTERRRVIRSLVAATTQPAAARAKLLGVKGTTLEAATDADRSITKAPTVPAIERYTGVLYDALDHRSLTPAQRRRLDGSVVIVSGLWGLVTPTDPIPDYRLKMGATLPDLGKLATWWRKPLTDALEALARGRAIWNLLPNEHAAAWTPSPGVQQWTVRFLDHRADGSLVPVSHDNKSLKGHLVRHLVAHPATSPADLARWTHPQGYRYAARETTHVAGTTVVSMIRR